MGRVQSLNNHLSYSGNELVTFCVTDKKFYGPTARKITGSNPSHSPPLVKKYFGQNSVKLKLMSS